MRSACSSARPTVSAAIRFRLATQTANSSRPGDDRHDDVDAGTRQSAARVTSFPVTHVGLAWIGAARGVDPAVVHDERVEQGRKRNEKTPLCRVGRSMNLRKQVEPL